MRTMYGIIASFWFLWWLYRLLSRQERYKLVHHIPTLWIVWSILSHSAVGHFLCPKSICPIGKHMHNCIRIIWIYGARVLAMTSKDMLHIYPIIHICKCNWINGFSFIFSIWHTDKESAHIIQFSIYEIKALPPALLYIYTLYMYVVQSDS